MKRPRAIRAPDLFGHQQRDGSQALAAFTTDTLETQNEREQNHGHAVVEQRLSLKLYFELFGQFHRLEHGKHCNRIGRADQGAEEKGPRPGQFNSEKRGAEPKSDADEKGRKKRARDGKERHWQGSRSQRHEIDVERTGKQQEGQHTVQNEVGKIDFEQRTDQRIRDARLWKKTFSRDQRGRRRDTGQKQSDRMGQMKVTQIEPTEKGRQEEHQR